MEFADRIKSLADKVVHLKNLTETEEATKMAFVIPFIKALGYDVSDPREVIPEYVADIGIKKGEKIDYCIIKDGNPIIIIECKHWRENLNSHDSQLHRYFYTTTAKFAILTNGINYRFYTDSEQQNKMDDKPFWEFDITTLADTDINELQKYQKTSFDINQMFSTAIELKYSRKVKQIMKKELNDPSDDFIRFFAKQIYSGTVSKKIIKQFKGIVKKSLNQLISKMEGERSDSGLTEELKENKKEKILKPDGKVTKLRKIKIGSEEYTISRSYEILTKTAEWLINNGSLRQTDCPISTGRIRNLVHIKPIHRNIDDFTAPKILSNGLYIETHFSTIGCIKNARKLLESCGHNGQLLIIE